VVVAEAALEHATTHSFMAFDGVRLVAFEQRVQPAFRARRALRMLRLPVAAS